MSEAARAMIELGRTVEKLLDATVAQLTASELAEYKRLLDAGYLPFDALAQIAIPEKFIL